MNFDKKAILAFLLIGLVFLLVQTPFYKKMFFPQLYQQEQLKKLRPDSTITNTNIGTALPILSEPLPEKFVSGATTPELTSTTPVKNVVIETNLYRATFSSQGALLTGWTLKKYKDGYGHAVEMVNETNQANFGIAFVNHNGDSVSTASWRFSCDADTFLDATLKSQKLRFEFELSPGQKIVKEFEFLPNVYHINHRLHLDNMNQTIADKAYTFLIPSGLNITEKHTREDMNYAKTIVAAAGEYSKTDKCNGQLYKETGSIDWVAVRTKYFLLAVIPQQSKGVYAQTIGKEYSTRLDPKDKWKKFTLSVTMPYTQNMQTEDFKIFLGPMDDEILKSYGVGLENSMDMGMKVIQPISVAVLWSFKKIHKYVSNYGLVLIIFSLLLKIITTPLTNKSYTSMKKMQTLQPLMADLKEKYGKDPQRLNKETMKLYKEQGINPMSGCFPVLLQIPIFIALFNVFRSTIELRQQGFFGWITDLSVPDTVSTVAGIPINVLPILMGLTMILQQQQTVTDPKQKAMVYLMPALMIFMFYSFPSGLNLYYTIFNMLAIIQQKYLMPSA
jgi:YidC/Oxa1 family membrane protein insertase